MTASNIFILSDVHIGTNLDTNWYNHKYHGPYLAAILQYVAEQAMLGQVQELIFLGDLFDQWMYAPNVQPPSVKEIIGANKNIFGPPAGGSKEEEIFTGPMKAAIKAVVENRGKVSYVHGNHDMMVTREEIAAVSPDMNFTGEWLYVPDNCEEQLVLTHGHLFSLFCAPNREQHPPGLSPLPLGHFVSRLSALWCLQQGYKGWYEKGSGNPNGIIFDFEALKGIFTELLEKKDRLADITMGALMEAVGCGPESGKPLPVTLRDGTVIEAASVGTLYNMMWKRYPAFTGVDPSIFGNSAREYALMETDAFSRLNHFVNKLWKKYTVVAMGHTHKPEDEQKHRFIGVRDDNLYVNSGFICPAEQNIEAKDKAPTFSQISVDRANRCFSSSVYQSKRDAGGNYKICLLEGPVKVPFRKRGLHNRP